MPEAPKFYIVSIPGVRGGRPHIKGKGVTVEFLFMFIDDPEWPVEKIADGWNLTPAEIHAAWSYYYDHKEEIEERRQRDEEIVEKMNLPRLSDLPGYAEFMEEYEKTQK